jgi:hypothetical protein
MTAWEQQEEWRERQHQVRLQYIERQKAALRLSALVLPATMPLDWSIDDLSLNGTDIDRDLFHIGDEITIVATEPPSCGDLGCCDATIWFTSEAFPGETFKSEVFASGIEPQSLVDLIQLQAFGG